MSEERRRPRGGRRFGFSGPRRQVRFEDEDVSVDDILDSLSRRSQLSDRLGRDEMSPLGEGLERRVASEPMSRSFALKVPHHSLGKYIFALLLLGGVLIVGLYGALKSVTQPSMILRVVQNPTFASVFTDPVRLGLVALFCLIPVFVVRRRRSARNRLSLEQPERSSLNVRGPTQE